jgi:NADPH-dependent ferric siderophore reductase
MTNPAPRRVERVRHERAYRVAEVVEAHRLSPRMRRVVFQSDELSGFRSEAYDDHIRLFIPRDRRSIPRATRGPNGLIFPAGSSRPASRDYTPRAFEPAENRLTVDFVLHGEGPGSAFGERAAPGDAIGIAGPVNSMVVRGDFDWYLLIGDETALPAIGRRIEELPVGSRVIAFVEIANADERQTFDTLADVEIHWLERDRSPAPGTLLFDTIHGHPLPAGVGFSFVACENSAARAIRRHLVEDRRFDPDFIKAYRFWQRGTPDLGQS